MDSTTSSGEEPKHAGPRGRSIRGVALVFLFLALVITFGILSPPESGDASGIYLHRSRAILGALPPGTGTAHYPGSSAWIGYPLALTQWIGFHVAGGQEPTIASYLEQTGPAWRSSLRWIWAGLASLVSILALCLTRRICRLLGFGEGVGAAAAVATLFILLFCPGVVMAVSGLSPALPAAILLLLATSILASDRRPDGTTDGSKIRNETRDEVRDEMKDPRRKLPIELAAGLVLGMLLAWSSFAWIPVLFFLVCARFGRGWSWSGVVRAGLLAIVLGLALEPGRLLEPGLIPETVALEWGRAGGRDLAGAPFSFEGLLAFLALSRPLGVALWGMVFLSLLALLRGSGRVLAVWLTGIWLSSVLWPGMEGLRAPGPLQAMQVPLWAVFAGVGIVIPAGIGGRPIRGRRWALSAILAGVVLLGLFPARSTLSAREIPPEELGREMAREIAEIVGPERLWLAERPLPGGVESPGRVLILPRDSRDPARYDFAYWPRWYGGFRYILISVSQLRQNVLRDQALLPRHLYRRIRTLGSPLGEWGRIAGTGEPRFRLYELEDRPDGDWAAPLTEEELGEILSVPELSPFLSQLGSLYAEAGDLTIAELLFRRGIELDPDAAPLYNNLTSVYLLAGESEEAARVVSKGLERAPESAELLYNAGRAYQAVGSLARAERFLRQAVGRKPDFAPAHYELARAFLGQGKRELARMALENYLEIDPGTSKRSQVESVLAELAGGPGKESESAVGVSDTLLPGTEVATPARNPSSPLTR